MLCSLVVSAILGFDALSISAPSIVSCTRISSTTVSLSWTSVSGVSHYVVRRGYTDSVDSSTSIATLKGIFYIDRSAGADDCYYWVEARGASGASAQSGMATASGDNVSAFTTTAAYVDGWSVTNLIAVGTNDLRMSGGVEGVRLWKDGPYWAECNVGATKPEESGYYFWWGDTAGYKRNDANDGWVSVNDGSAFIFRDENCPTYGKGDMQLEAAGYSDSSGTLTADAATVYLGAEWRMPTDAEFMALVSECTMTRTKRGRVYGCLVTGKGAYASRSVFLPAAGYGYDTSLFRLGHDGGYWSSSADSVHSACSWGLVFGSLGSSRCDRGFRCYGQVIRPVRSFVK